MKTKRCALGHKLKSRLSCGHTKLRRKCESDSPRHFTHSSWAYEAQNHRLCCQHVGWRHTSLRQCLIRIARYISQICTTQSRYRSLTRKSHSHWNEINTDIPCAIGFADEEINAHLLDGEGWNENADFWDSLEGFVHRDGWTSNENYEQAFEMFARSREQALQRLSVEELMEFEQSTRWAVRKHETTGKKISE